MRMVFIHGGGDGAFVFDSDVVSRLHDALGDAPAIEYPHLDGLERIEWQPAHAQLTEFLSGNGAPTIVVAHSIGAAAVLKLLARGEFPHVVSAFLLAPPYKGADSHWGVDDFTLPDDFADRLLLDVALYYCNDDEIIPVDDAQAYRAKLPAAKVSLLPSGGHQFTGVIDVIANDIRVVLRQAQDDNGGSG